MMRIKRILKNTPTLLGLFLMLGAVGAQAATLTVTTTADNGVGSLRQAIIDANVNAEANIVTFAVPMNDLGYNPAENRFTINLLSPLPDIPAIPLTISNDQPQAMTVKGNNTFRIFTLVDSAVFTVNNLTVSSGYSSGSGGGILMGNSSTLHLNRSTISNNAANEGGGIYVNQSGTLNMDASTVSGNTATSGGGIYNNTSGTVNATSSTIDGNTADFEGGGIYNTATITLTNNTVSGNSANRGGGIYNNFTATLNNSLVALNTGLAGADLFGRDSIGNIADTADGFNIGRGYTGAYNLIGNADDSDGLTAVTNRLGTTANPIDPLLGALQNNGGATLTRALLEGSPAIDKGDSPGIVSDQRGAARPYDNPLIPNDGGNGADIGAFEVQPAPAATVSVSGHVLLSKDSDTGISGANIYLTDAAGIARTTQSDAFGYYSFAEVPAGATYTFSVRHKRHRFHHKVITVTENLTEVNFTAF